MVKRCQRNVTDGKME